MARSTVQVLKRWMDLDFELYLGNLRLSKFAQKWNVDVKTIRRDLKAFQALGYESRWREDMPGFTYVWSYPRRVQPPMFTNTKEQVKRMTRERFD
jgi:hypothetical protein